MPTVMRIGAFRFLYSNEGNEPAHIHVEAAENAAKYWFDPLTLAWNFGFNTRELRQIEGHISDNIDFLLESWHEYFGMSDDGE